MCDFCGSTIVTFTLSTSNCGCCDNPVTLCLECAKTKTISQLMCTKNKYGMEIIKTTGMHYTVLTTEEIQGTLGDPCTKCGRAGHTADRC